MLFKAKIRLWEGPKYTDFDYGTYRILTEHSRTIRLAEINTLSSNEKRGEVTNTQAENLLDVFRKTASKTGTRINSFLHTILTPYPGYWGTFQALIFGVDFFNKFPEVVVASDKSIYDLDKYKYFVEIDYGDGKTGVFPYYFDTSLSTKTVSVGSGHYYKNKVKMSTRAGTGYSQIYIDSTGYFRIWLQGASTVYKETDAFFEMLSNTTYSFQNFNDNKLKYEFYIAKNKDYKRLEGFYTNGFLDPNDTAGNSDEHTGPGDFTDSKDTEGFPELPNISVVNAGLASIYVPTLPQLNALAKFLWSNDFIDTIKKAFSNPMEAIISLSMIRCPIPKAGKASVKIGMVDSGVEMSQAEKQFIDLDFGSRTITQYWGSALDFSPYTKFSIYLPYIGFKDLDVSEIWTGKFDTTGKPVHIKYHIDILSGAVIAFIKIGDNVLYQFQGSCTVQIPLSMQSMMGIYQTIATTGANIGGLIASGGMTAPMAIGAIANTATNVTNMSESVVHSGSIGNAGGFMAKQRPYIIKTRPVQSLPKNYKEFLGYPSNIYGQVGSFSGFASFESVHFKSSRALNAEVDEINNLLKEGVIL